MDDGVVALRYLRRPLVVACLVIWIANDHWGKSIAPGVLTGKLSDVAGLVVFVGLVALVVELAVPTLHANVVGGTAWLLTASGFVAVKTVPIANAFALSVARHLVGVAGIARDPTDLLALLVLPPAWWLWCRPARRSAMLAQTLASWVVAALALAATTATSCAAVTPYTALSLQDSTTLAAYQRTAFQKEYAYTSTDAGLHWTPTDPRTAVQARDDGTQTSPAPCAPGNAAHCFKVKGDHVLESVDSGRHWRTSWTRSKWMPKVKDTSCGGGGQLNTPNQILFVGSGSSAVVVVGIGTDGVLRRTISGSTWQVVQIFPA